MYVDGRVYKLANMKWRGMNKTGGEGRAFYRKLVIRSYVENAENRCEIIFKNSYNYGEERDSWWYRYRMLGASGKVNGTCWYGKDQMVKFEGIDTVLYKYQTIW